MEKNESTLLNTAILGHHIGRAESMKDYEHLMGENAKFYPQWTKHIESLMQSRDMSIADLARACNITGATARSWLKKTPTQREKVIAIGLALGLDEEALNHLLVRYARYPRLYIKNPEDAIILFFLMAESQEKNGPAISMYSQFETYRQLYLEEVWRAACEKLIIHRHRSKQQWAKHLGIKELQANEVIGDLPRTRNDFFRVCFAMQITSAQARELIAYTPLKSLTATDSIDKEFMEALDKNAQSEKKHRLHMKPSQERDTMVILSDFQQMEHTKEKQEVFRAFVRAHIGDFFARYERIGSYLAQFCEGGVLGTELMKSNVPKQILSAMVKAQSEQRSMHPRQRKDGSMDRFCVPDRDDMIALGIHLRMTCEQINHLLDLSGMEGLCPKHYIEGAVLFTLTDLELNMPSIFYDSPKHADIQKVDPDDEIGRFFVEETYIDWDKTAEEMIVYGMASGKKSDIVSKLSQLDLDRIRHLYQKYNRTFSHLYTEVRFCPESIAEYVKQRIGASCLNADFESSRLYSLL